MGEDVLGAGYTREQRRSYREKVRQCLYVFERMLTESRFDVDDQLTGLEIELNLVDAQFGPAMVNAAVLENIADPDYQTELGQYNIELNVSPRTLHGDALSDLETRLRASLNAAETKAGLAGGHIVMIGILPTVTPQHFHTGWMSANTRYAALNESVFAARGEDLLIDIQAPDGGEQVTAYADTIAPESACTSVQLHQQVTPSGFAPAWNAAQALLGPQLAMGANSPYLFGRQLWAETRTELFLQATDTRSVELRNQGVRPRVFFGERWITSIFDLFEENVHYFPALLPEISDEDPVAVLDAGQAPRLRELRLHNGTIYRWNRPIYDVVDARPHLRVENRALPAGPTVVDVLANAAFYYGLLQMLRAQERPVWTKMSFATAQANFTQCARLGMAASVYWPGFGELPAEELVLRHLLPLAHQGLEQRGVSAAARERYLGVIEGRCKTGRNGAQWQVEAVRALERRGLDRLGAITQMLGHYAQGMHSNEPVHTWELP